MALDAANPPFRRGAKVFSEPADPAELVGRWKTDLGQGKAPDERGCCLLLVYETDAGGDQLVKLSHFGNFPSNLDLSSVVLDYIAEAGARTWADGHPRRALPDPEAAGSILLLPLNDEAAHGQILIYLDLER